MNSNLYVIYRMVPFSMTLSYPKPAFQGNFSSVKYGAGLVMPRRPLSGSTCHPEKSSS